LQSTMVCCGMPEGKWAKLAVAAGAGLAAFWLYKRYKKQQQGQNKASSQGGEAIAGHVPSEWILKFDHFENIHKLPVIFEGAPNFRQAPDVAVFGTGQPTEPTFVPILDHLNKRGFTSIVWINMRQEPVVYVNGQSFTPRVKSEPNENIDFGEVDGDTLGQLTSAFGDSIRAKAQRNQNKVEYWRDTYAEHPADRKNIRHEVPLDSSQSLSEVYENLARQGRKVALHRLPIADERAPSESDLELLTSVIRNTPKEAAESTAYVFNCQMGKGRTTTGMICASVLLEVLHGSVVGCSLSRRSECLRCSSAS